MEPGTKRYIQVLLMFFTLAILFVGCKNGGEDSPSAQALAFEKLAGSWGLSQGSIMVDGQDVSLNYADFALSITDGGYTTTNAGNLFSATGTWEWVDEEAKRISLQDGKEVTIVTLTETSFVFSFSFNGPVANLESGIAGNYTITVNK